MNNARTPRLAEVLVETTRVALSGTQASLEALAHTSRANPSLAHASSDGCHSLGKHATQAVNNLRFTKAGVAPSQGCSHLLPEVWESSDGSGRGLSA